MFLEKYSVIGHLPYISLLHVKDSEGRFFYTKKVLIADCEPKFLKEIIKEIKHYMSLTLDTLNSAAKTLLPVREIIVETTFLYIVLDYFEHTTKATEPMISKILEYTRLALLYLHANHVNHNNVSTKNLFFSETECRLGLFNVDRLISMKKIKGNQHSAYSPIELRKTKPNEDDFNALKATIKELSLMNNCSATEKGFHVKSLSIGKSSQNSSRDNFFVSQNKKKIIKHVTIFDQAKTERNSIRRIEKKRPAGLQILKSPIREEEEERPIVSNLPPINSKTVNKLRISSNQSLFTMKNAIQGKKTARQRISLKDLLVF
jgi:hypothetical protein